MSRFVQISMTILESFLFRSSNRLSSSRRKLFGTPNSHHRRRWCKASTFQALLLGCVGLLLLATLYAGRFVSHNNSHEASDVLWRAFTNNQQQQQRSSPTKRRNPLPQEQLGSVKKDDLPSTSTMRFSDFQQLAVDLARLLPHETLHRLEHTDPFETRAFERKLQEQETALGRTLTLLELQQVFPCPHARRISVPDLRNHSQAVSFRRNEAGTFLFFQHLRKAGGTHFCALATRNLPALHIPPYYCMPDYHWKHSNHNHTDEHHQACAGCLSHWTNAEITANMHSYRIAGNEWDAFDPRRHFQLPAVLATSVRTPLDRALSQFRFECVEDRGCHQTDIGKWWKQRRDLYNVYVWTFGGVTRLGRISQGAEFAEERAQVMRTAMDTLAKFHLVLVMEWLAYAGTPLREILGFHDTSAVTERVRPHIAQAKRQDHQERNVLGAAGIAKASWSAKEYLTPEQVRIYLVGCVSSGCGRDDGRVYFDVYSHVCLYD
jgi:hypothetical protein